MKYSIAYTTDNKPVAVIDEDILDGVPKSQWVQTVKDTISDKFSDGIPISGRLIKVNKITRSEYTNSKYSKYLKSADGMIYKDKLKATNNLDDIVLASTNYINEDLRHTRKDSFKEFARGNVLIRVGENDYSAKVIVGFTGSQQMVLYDVIDFNKTSFVTKEETPRTAMQNAGSDRNGVSTDTTVPQNEQSVNTNIPNSQKNDTKNLAPVREDVKFKLGRKNVDGNNNIEYNEENMSIGKESENNGTNSGILGQMENLQGQSDGQDNVRQRGSNSENLRKYMEVNGIFIEKEQELSANGDGWSNERLPYRTGDGSVS